MDYTLHGLWKLELSDGTKHEIVLPGTLDENKIGGKDTGANQWHPDAELGNANHTFELEKPIATRFTRKYVQEGPVRLTKKIKVPCCFGKRTFLDIERGRCVQLFINGKQVSHFVPASLSTPHVFEITNLLNEENEETEITIIIDNSYPNLPREAILFSSAATDETQTNWNGILGYFRIRTEESTFLSSVLVYPKKKKLTIQAEIAAMADYTGVLEIKSRVLEKPETVMVKVQRGRTKIVLEDLVCVKDAKVWEEYEGNMYELTATLKDMDTKTVAFGIRDFEVDVAGRLSLNNRAIFLRSESNCAVFPEEGHPPMDVEAWEAILNIYKSYGVNCMRFHSWCPPEAAFVAADKMGVLMQPELSHWNPKNALESEESYQYYRQELEQILQVYGNHPSFVMLTFGNELQASEVGHKRLDYLVKYAKELDNTRLYATGSNVHYGQIACHQESDFYTSQKLFDHKIRGTYGGNETETGQLDGYINNQYPSAMTNYDTEMAYIRKSYAGAVFSFEVGQYEILPDFDELEKFRGVVEPVNYQLIREKVQELALQDDWKQYVEATGELSRLAYREEVEAVMRTQEMSGISLLGLQDFPGQGTALVGMLNAHFESKPFDFARPEAFCAFFRAQLPLVHLQKYTYESSETLKAEVKVANYGKAKLKGIPKFTLTGEDILLRGVLSEVVCPCGTLTSIGTLEVSLEKITRPTKLNLEVTIDTASNTYPIWVYPVVTPVCPKGVYETKSLDAHAKEVLEQGGKVYLSPAATKEQLPHSIKTQFTTDFWSVGTFSTQAGGMGQLIDVDHPIFRNFPTEMHSNWQWWAMASSRAIILPKHMKTIITEIDSYAYLRPMTKLMECRCGNGTLLLSSMELQNLQAYPEARALLSSIYQYLASEECNPDITVEMETIEALVIAEC